MSDERLRIPPRFLAACEFCGSEVHTEAVGTHVFTSGWVRIRADGGGNAIALPRREKRYAHDACIRLAAEGRTNQEVLF